MEAGVILSMIIERWVFRAGSASFILSITPKSLPAALSISTTNAPLALRTLSVNDSHHELTRGKDNEVKDHLHEMEG